MVIVKLPKIGLLIIKSAVGVFLSIVVKNFLVYFWIDEANEKVQITAVIYSKRDQISQLINMDMQ